MIRSFILGIGFYLIGTGIPILVSWSIAKLKRKKFAPLYDGYSFFLNLVIYSLLFGVLFEVLNRFSGVEPIQVVLGGMLFLVVMSYFHIIAPIRHLWNVGKTRDFDHPMLPVEIKKKYHIKVVEKEITNAFSTGILPFTRTILLGRPLVEKLEKEELYSILLHEVGHLEQKHLIRLYGIYMLTALFAYFLIYGVNIAINGFDNLPLELTIIGLTGGLEGFLLWYVPGKLQYRLEFQADAYAAEVNGSENMINALKHLDAISGHKVSKGGLTHPTLEKRIQHIRNL